MAAAAKARCAATVTDRRVGDLLNSRGYTLLKLGEAGRAAESLREAVRTNPENAEAWNNLVGGFVVL